MSTIVSFQVTMVVVGEDIWCEANDYLVYVPRTGPFHLCRPEYTLIDWEAANPVKCHFLCDCVEMGGCSSVALRIMKPQTLCEVYIYLDTDIAVTSPSVIP